RTRSAGADTTALGDVLGLEQARDRLRGLDALREPLLDLGLVELDQRRLVLRVVPPDDIDELAVARRARGGGDDAASRVLLRPDPRQPHPYCHPSPFSASRPFRGARASCPC